MFIEILFQDKSEAVLRAYEPGLRQLKAMLNDRYPPILNYDHELSELQENLNAIYEDED